MARRTTRKNGPGKKASSKKAAPRSKAKDSISPYYATMKYGSPMEKKAAKSTMKNYFSGKSAANRRKETESQHMARMAKRDTIPSARKSRGVYNAPGFSSKAAGMGKKVAKGIKKKR